MVTSVGGNSKGYGYLTIERVLHEDEGMYTCTATSQLGNVTTQTEVRIVGKCDSACLAIVQLGRPACYWDGDSAIHCSIHPLDIKIMAMLERDTFKDALTCRLGIMICSALILNIELPQYNISIMASVIDLLLHVPNRATQLAELTQ